MAVLVHLNRPHLQIPVGEAIEEILQYVLYHRRQVPVVVPALLNDAANRLHRNLHSDLVQLLTCSQGKKIEKFCLGFTAARDTVKEVFQSSHGFQLRRAAIVIGSSPSAPVDLYLIEFQAPHRQPNETQNACTSTGEVSSLSNGERRKIIRQLIDQGVCYRRGDRDFKEMNRAMKTFLFVEANRGVISESLQPRPDLDFLRYCVTDSVKPKRYSNVEWTVLELVGDSGCVKTERLTSPGSENLISVSYASGTQEEKDAIWYQFQEPIHGFDQ